MGLNREQRMLVMAFLDIGLPFFSVILNMLNYLFPHYAELVSNFGAFYLYMNLHFARQCLFVFPVQRQLES